MEAQDPQTDTTRLWTTDEVLRKEAEAIFGTNDLKNKSGVELRDELSQLDAAALCLSGGGIRSAAFALGVIEALAAHPRPKEGGKILSERHIATAEESLLAQFHYLSTVSGGGYIGSWLSAWVARSGFPTVWKSLVGRPDGPEIEPQVISWLREYGNYLTPKPGIMSADTWTAIALYGRNLLLNWLVIVPPICAVILVLKIIAVLSERLTDCEAWYVQIPIGMAGALCLVRALSWTTRHRPSRRKPSDASPDNADQPAFLVGCLPWSALSALLLTQFLASKFVGGPLLQVDANGDNLVVAGSLVPIVPWLELVLIPGFGVVGALLYALSWRSKSPENGGPRDFWLWTVSGSFYGMLVGWAFYFYLLIPAEHPGEEARFISSAVTHLIFGVPWILLAQTVADTAFVGLASFEPRSDADREWLGRAAGWYLAIAAAWCLVMFFTFAGFTLLFSDNTAADIYRSFQDRAPLIATVSGIVAALAGRSSWTGGKDRNQSSIWSLPTNLLIAVAAPVFAIALLFGLSSGLDQLLLGETLLSERYPKIIAALELDDPDLWPWISTLLWLLFGLAMSLVISVLASWCININRFSLHALYRNRLIRAFLGASHARKRQPDRFTDFDETDNLAMHELWPPKVLWDKTRSTGWQPFPVINVALNIVSTRRLAWQERKAQSFTVSPLHAGTPCGRRPGGDGIACGTFRSSQVYGGTDGIALGTAMAISGAAASPNMGYHSSPPVAFLMTLFNVRLGWWLGNPAVSDPNIFRSQGPRWAVVPLFNEMFGRTTDDRNYVYLSDGGHFENLGLYEMIRRRCRCILISDAGCDPDYGFEDVGNAVRKIEIDLGVSIDLKKISILKKRQEQDRDGALYHPYCVVGAIDYPRSDGGCDKGIILYIKPGYHGTESAGIRAYAIANPAFPHESTTDQFFGESQFESYRSLGFEITDDVLNLALDKVAPPDDRKLKTVFEQICKLAPAASTHPRSP